MNHPAKTVQDGTAVINQNSIDHHQLNENFRQSTSLCYTQRTQTTQNDGQQQLKHLSMGEPTYWPSDRNKLPEVDIVLQSKTLL
jgi:hypothetical protein